MKVIAGIQQALQEGRSTLTEAESKTLLRQYGIPVVKEAACTTPGEALQEARHLGYPVVLKGLGARLTHKTERGLVKLHLTSDEEVRQAAREIETAAGSDLEGYLVQPMLSGRREFVAGLFCDPLFGPVVMFGLGGVFTEALRDVVFRVAPFDEAEAALMMDEIRSAALLGAFRGEQPAMREEIIRTLAGLSQLAEECPNVTEVDINPLLIGPDGRVTAVDALVVLGKRAAPPAAAEPVDPRDLAGFFHPKSIAFIGASGIIGKWGHMLFTNVAAGGFEGRFHLVNPKGGLIAGRPVFKSVTDIPEPVDLAVVTVPAAGVSALLPEIAAKGIRRMLIITSGFSETGDKGRQIEREMVARARELGILILGPNTMGLCNPHLHFYCMGMHVRPGAGETGLVAQSGNLGTQLLAYAKSEGVGIRAFCGSGNEAMITIEDFLDAFENDDLTRSVVLYLESIKDGSRFVETARRVGRRKPVVVLKGGRTEAGNRAAASHTGALASNISVFQAACRQAGVVPADHPADLLDLSAAFSALPLPKGRRIGIATLGGGWGVVATDLCVENGLVIPNLTDEIIAGIDKILPPYWSRTNPIDLVAEFDPLIPQKIIEELLKWEECDAVLHLGMLGRVSFFRTVADSAILTDPNYSEEGLHDSIVLARQSEAEFSRFAVRMMETYQKPVLGVALLNDEDSRAIVAVEGSPFKGVAFPTPERAVRVLAKMCAYSCWLSREKGRALENSDR
ncbi:MAG: acetate--CoA ligase family protein [Syntrophales bacterium]